MSDFEAAFRSFLLATEWFSIIYFVAINSIYGLLLISAVAQVWTHAHRAKNERLWRVLGSASSPTVSVLVPAFNESATILASVKGFLSLSYPNLDVVVTNDGSEDETLKILRKEFSLYPVYPAVRDEVPTAPIRGIYKSRNSPNLTVVDKENSSSRADAVNAALKYASGELVCAIDADTIIEPDALQRLLRPFLTDDKLAAAGGTIRVVNDCTIEKGRVTVQRVSRNPVAGIQTVEYLRAFLFGRLGWNKMGGNLIISGAFGLFRRSVLMRIGGYTKDSIGEDMELIARIRSGQAGDEYPRGVTFIPDPVAWTEVPASLKILGNQRDRWHRGLADVVVRHRNLFFNPRHGALGMVVFPYFVFAELLSPIVEVAGIIITITGISLGIMSLEHGMIFLAAVYGYSLILTACILIIDEIAYSRYESMKDRFLLLTWLFLENFGYRQLSLYWRLRGMYKFLRNQKGWGKMERVGFADSAPGQ